MRQQDAIVPPRESDWAIQSKLLRGVSRTFALTIPQLPQELGKAVGNGYLLCRIADTIEDDPGIDLDAKFSFYEEFLNVLNKHADSRAFADRLHRASSSIVLPAERELVRETPTVVRLTHSLPPAQQEPLIRCARIMCNGMYEFQVHRSLDGLESVDELCRYCYVVAGVVGEMLTDLFCDHSDAIRAKRDVMMELATSFGHGLQMTNILKNVWEDSDDGSCWLPRSVFREHGNDLGDIIRTKETAKLAEGIDELVGIAQLNLLAALDYSCLIPKTEVGIRRFCLWAIGLAVLTLQKIYRNPGYENGQQVKISRRRVRAIVLSCNSVIYSNRLVRAWFNLASFGLPLARPDRICDPEAFRLLAESSARQTALHRDSGVHSPS